MEIQTIFDSFLSIGTALVVWWVKGIREDFKEMKKDMGTMRTELHQELQHYTHKEICQAHRDGIQAQIDAIRKDHGAAITKAINDTRLMHQIYEGMTPLERRAHAAQCQFRGDMEGLG